MRKDAVVLWFKEQYAVFTEVLYSVFQIFIKNHVNVKLMKKEYFSIKE